MNGQISGRRRNLVIVRAGDNSLHPRWLAGGDARSWDIVVNYYGEQEQLYRRPDIERIDSKGPKWPALQLLLQETPRFLRDYDYVWLPDDDLDTTADQIDLLFRIMAGHNLQVAQPSLEHSSYFGHLTTLHNNRFRIRYTNYVEVMAPCFTTAVLERAVPLFNANLSGWGLDFVWPKLVDEPASQIAIIDAVQVRHTRPVGGPNYKMLRERGVSPWDELRSFCRMHDIEEEPVIATLAAVTSDGNLVDAMAQQRRFVLRLLAGYLPALKRTPQRQHMLRRMGGMLWKALNNLPDRVAELPMPRKLALRRP